MKLKERKQLDSKIKELGIRGKQSILRTGLIREVVRRAPGNGDGRSEEARSMGRSEKSFGCGHAGNSGGVGNSSSLLADIDFGGIGDEDCEKQLHSIRNSDLTCSTEFTKENKS